MDNDNEKGTDAPELAKPVALTPSGPVVPHVEPIFSVGDIVALKSGGMSMTLARNIGDGRCECCYFNTRDMVYSGAMFFQDMLQKS